MTQHIELTAFTHSDYDYKHDYTLDLQAHIKRLALEVAGYQRMSEQLLQDVATLQQQLQAAQAKQGERVNPKELKALRKALEQIDAVCAESNTASKEIQQIEKILMKVVL